jgi:thioredoxin 1
MVVEVIDVRENRSAAQAYGIRVIPTQVFFDASGKERFRHEGFMSREAILATWDDLGVDFEPASPSQTAR